MAVATASCAVANRPKNVVCEMTANRGDDSFRMSRLWNETDAEIAKMTRAADPASWPTHTILGGPSLPETAKGGRFRETDRNKEYRS